MGRIDLSLDERSEQFIAEALASGRYGSASDVVRDGLRALEEREARLAALRAHVGEGAAQADRGEFVDFDLTALIARLDAEE